jgi:hypothetical protein
LKALHRLHKAQSRGGLGPKSPAIGFIKSHRAIAEKTPIPLKMHLKNLAILEKASISLKKFSKIVATFIKPQYF